MPVPLSPPEIEETERWLELIGRSLQSEAFASWNASFLAQHCGSFDDAEENKLEHTAIHEAYQAGVEAQIETAIGGTDVDMGKLLERLPSYLDRRHADSATTSAAIGECIETLTSLTEFDAFKAAMLVAKKDLPGGGSGVGGSVAPPDKFADATAALADVDGIVEFGKAMDSDADGWVQIASKPWLTIDKKPAPGASKKSDIVMRYAMDLDLPFEQLVEMICDFSDRRKAWDDTLASMRVLHTFIDTPERSDKVVHARLNIPYLVRLAGYPSELTMRVLVVGDTPAPGERTFVAAAWDEKAGKVDLHNSAFSMSLAIMRPSADDPAKARYTGIERTQTGGAPDWLLGWLAATFSPRYMLAMVDKYKRYKRQHSQ
jgi:hypothetical protein